MTAPARSRKAWRWVAAAAGLVALVVAGRFVPVREWLASFRGFIGGLGLAGGVLYGLVYVLAALLFVPGILLTLGAGLAFGLGWGVVVVSLASTTAAAAAFLIARYAARRRVETLARKHPKFAAVDRAIAKNGWKVVVLLRLSPVIPFSISNYLYGLTAVRFLPYIVASWAAMLPATFLYVYLGAAGASLGGSNEKSPWEWLLLGGGLAATVAVTMILARVAKRELDGKRVAGK